MSLGSCRNCGTAWEVGESWMGEDYQLTCPKCALRELQSKMRLKDSALGVAAEGAGRMIAVMRDNDLAIEDMSDPMQWLAFTMYTELVAISNRAIAALEADDE